MIEVPPSLSDPPWMVIDDGNGQVIVPPANSTKKR